MGKRRGAYFLPVCELCSERIYRIRSPHSDRDTNPIDPIGRQEVHHFCREEFLRYVQDGGYTDLLAALAAWLQQPLSDWFPKRGT